MSLEHEISDAKIKLQHETYEAISRIHREQKDNSTYIGIDGTDIFASLFAIGGLVLSYYILFKS